MTSRFFHEVHFYANRIQKNVFLGQTWSLWNIRFDTAIIAPDQREKSKNTVSDAPVGWILSHFSLPVSGAGGNGLMSGSPPFISISSKLILPMINIYEWIVEMCASIILRIPQHCRNARSILRGRWTQKCTLQLTIEREKCEHILLKWQACDGMQWCGWCRL